MTEGEQDGGRRGRGTGEGGKEGRLEDGTADEREGREKKRLVKKGRKEREGDG